MPNRSRKGVALFIVLGIIMLVMILTIVILRIMFSQSRLTHHQVSRIKAYYAGKSMMNYAFEMLRTGAWIPNPSGGANKYACHSSDETCIDSVTNNYPILPYDSAIGYKVQVTIYPQNTALNNTVTRLDIKTEYTYTP